MLNTHLDLCGTARGGTLPFQFNCCVCFFLTGSLSFFTFYPGAFSCLTIYSSAGRRCCTFLLLFLQLSLLLHSPSQFVPVNLSDSIVDNVMNIRTLALVNIRLFLLLRTWGLLKWLRTWGLIKYLGTWGLIKYLRTWGHNITSKTMSLLLIPDPPPRELSSSF